MIKATGPKVSAGPQPRKLVWVVRVTVKLVRVACAGCAMPTTIAVARAH